MIARRISHRALAAPGRSWGRHFTEEEEELLEYDRTHGETDQPQERDAVFQLLGIGSALTLSLFGWVAFKTIWFGWLAMPGWW